MLKVGLHYLKHAYDPSDENVLARWNGLPGNIEFSTEYNNALLGGLVVLHGRTPRAGGSPTKTSAIPYYACNNRNVGEMAVWLRQND